MSQPEPSGETPPHAPQSRLLADGPGWTLHEFICEAGPQDRPFEEQHAGVTIAAVISGSFNYRTETGSALLYPGALVLGNPGACFQCGHEHGVGDRCASLQLAPDYFAEIAASAAGGSRFRFGAPLLAAGRETLPCVSEMAAGIETAEPMEGEIAVARIVERVVGLESGSRPSLPAPSARDERRISAVLRHMEEHADEPLALDALAAMAAMSKYHFLRVFQRIAGMTPYQFLLNCRMRRAATGLRRSSEPIAQIAFAAGFGDLSTFNRRFRETFGLSPKAFRADFAKPGSP
jgi:AraC family transcriptional regulator